jgi:TetR/AcrR family transcriptional repressor of bet genes
MSTGLERKPAAAIDRRRSRSIHSRNALVAAAIRSIAERGLSETTLATVSEMSGLSRSLVAFHFESKDALIRAALAAANRVYELSWRKAVQAERLPPRRQLEAAIRHDIGFASRHPELLHLWFAIWGEARAQAIYREQALPMDRRYVEELCTFAVNAGLGKTEAEDMARIVNAFIYGSWLEAHLDPDGYSPRKAERAGLRVSALLQATSRSGA